MLDRQKIESRYHQSVDHEWLELTDLEVRLIKLYRQIPENDRRQVRRIAGYLAEPTDIE
ncbi:hypothetical protein C4J96_3911 [Pseudomonas orientalis]|uniref:hypothetical protein n=1 Tax=Pseudomonas orientalis TaxID=76758 RepID=UPI000F6DA611|nr:hypothetical protein [Pseudomonas orientalis]AZE96010.1 hypothetical protein C4J96_3911 [Pseudomonas orientalis]